MPQELQNANGKAQKLDPNTEKNENGMTKNKQANVTNELKHEIQFKAELVRDRGLATAEKASSTKKGMT